MVYFPLMSVRAPIVVPGTETDTPGIAPSPSTEEVTVPVMTFVCAHRVVAPAKQSAEIVSSYELVLGFKLTCQR
jgi:hypothetical protein